MGSPEENKFNAKSKPPVVIIVNTREFEWGRKEISYSEVYDLAFPSEPLAEGDVARIEYSRGTAGGGHGKLVPGESVKVKPAMVFDVYVTVRS